MKEKKIPPRGLEDVSHFFLSSPRPADHPKGGAEKSGSSVVVPPHMFAPEALDPSLDTASREKHPGIKLAHGADPATLSGPELRGAARAFLLGGYFKEGFSVAPNIDSPEFGSSDLLLVDKSKINIICAKLHHGRDCEAFVVSAMAYYFWLKEFLKVGAIFLQQQAHLDMFLFSGRFPASISCLTGHLKGDTRVHLIQYNVFNVEGMEDPVVSFQYVIPGPNADDQRARKKGVVQRPPALPRQESESDAPDSPRREFDAFNRLKDRLRT